MKVGRNKFEIALIKSLRKEGMILPFDIEDFDVYLKKVKNSKTPPLPGVLNNAKEILRRGYVDKTYATEIKNETTGDMARAAREGKKLPKNIIDKMKKDRLNSKEND